MHKPLTQNTDISHYDRMQFVYNNEFISSLCRSVAPSGTMGEEEQRVR